MMSAARGQHRIMANVDPEPQRPSSSSKFDNCDAFDELRPVDESFDLSQKTTFKATIEILRYSYNIESVITSQQVF